MELFPRLATARREARHLRNFELARALAQAEERDQEVKRLRAQLREFATTYECSTCGVELNNTAAHRIVDTGGKTDEMIAADGDGGTAMVAEYCQAHCPGSES